MTILDAGFFGDVGEGAIAVVVVENDGIPVGDVDVFVAIVVVIADGDAHGEAFAGDAGLRGDIGEGAVAIVAVEMIGGIGAIGVGVIGDAFEITATENVEVEQAVVVVVEPNASGACGFKDGTEFLFAEGMLETNFALLGDVFVGWKVLLRRSGRLRCVFAWLLREKRGND